MGIRPLYLLSVWGRDQEQNWEWLKCAGGLVSHEICDNAGHFWFKMERDRNNVGMKLAGLVVQFACDPPESMFKPVGHIILEHNGKQYQFDDEWNWGLKKENMRFQWEENNNGCDCNRSMFIQECCDPCFPEMDCGEKIKLLELDIELVAKS